MSEPFVVITETGKTEDGRPVCMFQTNLQPTDVIQGGATISATFQLMRYHLAQKGIILKWEESASEN